VSFRLVDPNRARYVRALAWDNTWMSRSGKTRSAIGESATVEGSKAGAALSRAAAGVERYAICAVADELKIDS
jgi:hypothetical protein